MGKEDNFYSEECSLSLESYCKNTVHIVTRNKNVASKFVMELVELL